MIFRNIDANNNFWIDVNDVLFSISAIISQVERPFLARKIIICLLFCIVANCVFWFANAWGYIMNCCIHKIVKYVGVIGEEKISIINNKGKVSAGIIKNFLHF